MSIALVARSWNAGGMFQVEIYGRVRRAVRVRAGLGESACGGQGVWGVAGDGCYLAVITLTGLAVNALFHIVV